MNRTIIDRTNKFLLKHLTLMLLGVGVLLPAVCYVVLKSTPNENYQTQAYQINKTIDDFFFQTENITKQWLNYDDPGFLSKQWKIGTPEVWENREISLYLYRADSMLLWSNHVYAVDIDVSSLPTKDTVIDFQNAKLLARKSTNGDKISLVLLRLKDSAGDINEDVFGKGKFDIFPKLEPNGKNNLFAVGNRFYISPIFDPSPPLSLTICSWIGVILMLLGVKRFFRQRTKPNNVCKTNGLFFAVLAIIGAFLVLAKWPTYDTNVLGHISINYGSWQVSAAQLLVIFVIIQIYTMYLYSISGKISYCYKKLSKSKQYVVLWLVLIFINVIVVFFHYTMVKIINDVSINIELYKFTLVNLSTLLFYFVGALFVASRILLNAFVRKIFTYRSVLHIVVASVAILTLMTLPLQQEVGNTTYLLVLSHTIFISFAFLENKKNEYSIFVSMVAIFAAYIMMFSIIESNAAAQKNAQNYAHELVNTPNTTVENTSDQYRKLTYYKVSNHEIEVKDNNSFDLQLLSSVIEKGVDTTVSAGGYAHYVYHSPEGQTIVVSRQEISILDNIAFFAYIFISLYFVTGLMLRFSGYTNARNAKKNSLVLRIRFIVVGIVVFTMILVVGVISVNTFHDYENTQKNKANTKLQSLMNSFKRYATNATEDQNKSLVRSWFNDSQDVVDKDLAIYDSLGNCIESTFDSSSYNYNKMDSKAYSVLHWRGNPFYNHLIDYDNRTAISAYIPMYNNNILLGYLKIEELDHVNSIELDPRFEILTHIVNILVVVVLIGLILSMLLYRTLTRPLARIYDGISNISAMRRIEESEGNDEISMLIKQYNRMIDFLEESYEALARSEREGAWRGMALQVAHEIKNPLTPMKLKIQMLQRARNLGHNDLDEKTDATLDMLLEQIDLLAKIASEFSAFARINNMEIERFDVSRILATVSELYSDNCNINFEVLPVETELMVEADYSQILRVLINLCQNAIQAVSSRDNGHIFINATREGGWVVITVTDNGYGISEHTKNRIFEPNFTTKSSGTGLGLAISRQIILNFGGKIFFESEECKGAVFSFSLPYSAPLNSPD